MKIKRIAYNPFIWMLIIIPFIKPSYLDSLPFWDNLFSVYAVIVFFLVLILYIKLIGLEHFFLLCGGYYTIFIISTIINRGWPNISSAIIPLINGLSIYMIVRLIVFLDTNLIFSSLLPLLKIIVIWNYISVLMFPEGMYTVQRRTGWESNDAWVLGLRNGESFFLVFFLCLLTIEYVCKGKSYFRSIKLAFYYLLVCSTLFRITGGGSYIAIILIISFAIFHKAFYRIPFFNAENYALGSVLFLLGVVMFQIQRYFSWLIVSVLGKDLTFTGRTLSWGNAIHWIMKKPILGWGYEDEVIISGKLSAGIKYTNGAFMATHNTFLECLYKGGIVATIAFVLIIILTIRRNKNNCSVIWSIASYYFFLTTFALAQTETVTFSRVFLWFLTMTYFIAEIERDYNTGHNYSDNIRFVWNNNRTFS